MPSILISEVIHPSGLERLSSLGEVHYEPELWNRESLLEKWIREADAWVVRNQTAVSAERLAMAVHLQVVGRLGVGLDNIDVKAARQKGIPVVSARGANATAVAEYVMASLLHVTRRLPEVSETVRRGAWDRRLGGTELYGKTMGLIGLGDIGQRVAARCRAFGMRVLAYDPYHNPSQFAVMDLGVELTDLESVCRQADFLSIHAPLTDATRNLLDKDRMSLMKPSAYLINTARGGIVDEEALLSLVRENRLHGAVLDVQTKEPPDPDNPLNHDPRILTTPHISGLTDEAGVRTALMVAEDVERVLQGQTPLFAV